MLTAGHAIVIDAGKTISKVSLWSRDGRLLDRQMRPNAPVEIDGIARLDAQGIGDFVLEALAGYRGEPVEAIIPVAHGAGVAAIRDDALAYPPFDYEAVPPADLTRSYGLGRPAFAETGSPRLAGGLNLGAQLHWAESLDPAAHRGATLVPWAQYWAWFLSGIVAAEVSSLGCHTDLWCPPRQTFSTMARARGWADRFGPVTHAAAAIGHLRPEIASRCGLPGTTRILAGLHDSNAALLAARGFAELRGRDVTILSTGTWFIAMRQGFPAENQPPLPEARDCLVNVDVDGQPVPSARWMGGREVATVIGGGRAGIDVAADQASLLAAAAAIVDSGAMYTPSAVAGVGPFPHSPGGWHTRPANPEGIRCAAALYAALMTDASLDLVGTSDTLLIEGRFARSEVLTRALAALRPGCRVLAADGDTDVSFGALRLALPELRPAGQLREVAPLPGALAGYRSLWRQRVERQP